MASIPSKSPVNQQLHISDENCPDHGADINRSALTACIQCRARRIRCDAGLPCCGPCDRSNVTCYYSDTTKGNKKVNRTYVIHSQNKVRELQAELAAIEIQNTSGPDPPSYYEVPDQRVDGFVGREDILQSIDNALSEGSGPRYAVLYGMSGQGKSQVALEYCHRKKGRRYSAIFWVDATSQNRAESSFRSISERIKRQTDDLLDIKAIKAFGLKTFTSWTVPWLMVFDNYDNPDTFPNIRDFIPQSEFGAILIISRRPDSTALVIDQSSHFLQLSGLEESAAVALLVQQSQTKEVNSSVANRVVERLGYHPLAITEAGAYIRKKKLPLDAYMHIRSAYWKHGRPKEAEELEVQVLRMRNRVLGPEHPETIKSIANLAWMAMDPKSALVQLRLKKNSFGYGSSKLLDSANPIPIERLAEEQQELESVSNDTEDISDMSQLFGIRPPVFDDEDISSQVRIMASTQRAIAEKQLAAMMAHHLDLDMAYDEAMALMPADRFVANFSHLLTTFYQQMRFDQDMPFTQNRGPGASTRLERIAGELIGSRGSRMRLARIISDTRNSRRVEIDARTEEDFRIALQRYSIEARVNPKEKGEPDEAEGIATESSSSDSESDERGEFPNIQLDIQQMEDFLTGSYAFRLLSHDFGISVLPRSLSQLALSIPPNQIRFSNYNDHSLSNKIKTFMEEHTGAQWNWWPLSPRKKLLGSNQTRMHWQCLCGKNLWTEMSKSQSIIFQKLSKNSISQPSQISLCSKVRKKGFQTSIAKWITNPDSASSNTQQSTPSGMSTSTSALIGSATTGPGPRTRLHPSEYSSGIRLYDNNSYWGASTNFRSNRLWTLFGVHGGRKTLELGQICSGDNLGKGFVRKLRESYRNLRGFRRVWFSFWQFSHCDFVKFEKIGKNRIISRCSDLPTSSNYEYFPRPPEADNPPITPHEFNLAFSSCGKYCLFAPFHDCFVLEDELDFALRIPKRKSKFAVENSIRQSTTRFAWGIQAQYTISFLHVLIYHILMMVGPTVSWVWWQKHHPNDLQNASIPLTVAAALISLFWSATGILRGFREPRET